MPRDFSTTFTNALMAESTGQVALWLLTISHPRLATPIRLVNNSEDVQSSGNTFTALAFDFILPDDKEGSIRKASLEIDNVDQSLIPTLRRLPNGITVVAQLAILTDDTTTPPEFDAIEIESLPMKLRDVVWDEFKIRGSISHEDYVRPFPANTFNPVDFPALF